LDCFFIHDGDTWGLGHTRHAVNIEYNDIHYLCVRLAITSANGGFSGSSELVDNAFALLLGCDLSDILIVNDGNFLKDVECVGDLVDKIKYKHRTV
jgi:hypothetical protein